MPALPLPPASRPNLGFRRVGRQPEARERRLNTTDNKWVGLGGLARVHANTFLLPWAVFSGSGACRRSSDAACNNMSRGHNAETRLEAIPWVTAVLGSVWKWLPILLDTLFSAAWKASTYGYLPVKARGGHDGPREDTDLGGLGYRGKFGLLLLVLLHLTLVLLLLALDLPLLRQQVLQDDLLIVDVAVGPATGGRLSPPDKGRGRLT